MRKGTDMIDYLYPMTLAGDEVAGERVLTTKIEAGLMMDGVKSVRWIILHCSATREDRDYTALQMLNDHRLRGFRTVGYHLYIRRNGVVTQHRPLLEVGAHCRPYYRCSIGICYEGGLDPQGRPKDTRTPQQKEQLLSLLVRLKQLFPQARVRGHCEMRGATPKACPCFLPSAEYAHLDKNLG